MFLTDPSEDGLFIMVLANWFLDAILTKHWEGTVAVAIFAPESRKSKCQLVPLALSTMQEFDWFFHLTYHLKGSTQATKKHLKSNQATKKNSSDGSISTWMETPVYQTSIGNKSPHDELAKVKGLIPF